VPMPWDWPVDVTYYEAKAFCKWKQQQQQDDDAKSQTGPYRFKKPYRLLTEAEHHLIRHKDHNLEAARKDVAADRVMVTAGSEFGHGKTGANLNLAYSSQNPVTFFAPSETGHYDSTGSAWEWTEDHFNPLKGFEVHHVYDDFSTPCFDGKHSMIVGGSFISTGDEASVFARFHFRPHFLQHSGFRLVASDHEAPATHLYAGSFDGQAAARDAAAGMASSQAHPSKSSNTGGGDNGNVYETDSSLHTYLGLHYPSSGEAENIPPILPHDNAPVHGLGFPQRVVGLLNRLAGATGASQTTALDIGCAVGGASFELAKTYDQVDAFDFSQSFVNAAKRMQSDPDSVRFNIPMEAELVAEVQAVHEYGVTEHERNKVNFFTGDACALGQMVDNGQVGKSYDGVVMSNLLCRLPDPIACLDGLPLIVKENGIVVMVTPFSWLDEFTPRAKWIGGFLDPVTKQPIHSKDVLRGLMAERGFAKIHEEQVPVVIREHQRKMQYIISEATGWRKV
jgi:putative 4-mercaptohistidine N1-methyltranferase